jgi:SAF domain
VTATGSTDTPLRGAGGQIFDLQPPKATAKSRVPEVALGLLLVVGGALAALVWQVTANQTTPVLAAAHDIAQGTKLTDADLEIVEIRSNDQLRVLHPANKDLIVGRVTLTTLGRGTVLTPEDVSQGSTIQQGDGVVGLSLAPGEYPSLRLAPGDVVSVVLVPGAGEDPFAGGSSGAISGVASQILVARAVIAEATPLGSSGSYFVSLTMTEPEAAVTARAGALGRVRLVEVADG